MTLDRRHVKVGLVSLGAIAGLAGGGVAFAAAGPASGPSPSATSDYSGYCRGSMFGAFDDAASPMTTVASYLGLTPDQLRDRMHDGQSLAEIAKAQGKSLPGLKNAMVAAMQKRLAADTSLTAEQRTKLLDQMRSRVDAMVTASPGSGGGMRGMMGAARGGMSGMMD